MASQAELRESHAQLSEVWSIYARCSGAAEVVDIDGLRIANARHPWFFLNAALLTEPVSSQTDLEARARTALAYFESQPEPWFFAGGRHWLGDGASETLSRLGLTKVDTLVGMVAEQLASPAHPLPEVETRRIDDEQGRLALADLNAGAYDVPLEWTRGFAVGESLWQSPLCAYVAYVEGTPVSTAFAMPLDGVLYVGLVATAIAHRRRGLAELVMRRSVADATRATGITRTALHATSEGYSLYSKMGYRTVDEFGVFVQS
jgi:hypothetical protein